MARPRMTLEHAGAAIDRTVRFAVWLTAVAAAWLMAPRAPLYWDTSGYVTQALTGHVGGLALGRPLYVLASHALARTALRAGASVWQLEGILHAAWLPLACLSAPLLYELARALRYTRLTSALAASLLATSPAFAHTAGAVLTDAPAITTTLAACVLAARAAARGSIGGALAAGASLGVAIGVREQSAAQAVTLVLMFAAAPAPWRRRVWMTIACGGAALVLAAIPVLYVAHTQPGYLATISAWVHGMQHERAHHAYSLHEALVYFAWLVALGPVALFGALAAWTCHARAIASWRTFRFAVTVPALLQLVLLGGYQDIAYSPRYLLPALAGAVCVPAAHVLGGALHALRARMALAFALVVPLVLGALGVRTQEAPLRRTLDALPSALRAAPSGAVIVTGAPCPVIALDRVLLRREPRGSTASLDWQTVCPGWTWPPSLDARLEDALRSGHTVLADLRLSSWPGGQQAELREVERFVVTHPLERGSGQIRLW